MTALRFSAERIATVAVIGAGTMGHGIAHVAALAGAKVALFDVDAAAASRGVARIAANLDKGVGLGKISTETRNDALARIHGTGDLVAACAGADAVVEAVPERLPLKRDLFREVESLARAALLASNTSSLSISSIASALKDPSRLVGMHFFNPVHVMKLVEIVRHRDADPSAVAAAVGWAERMGKTAITVTDSPGFASSRLGLVLGLEAIRMVEQGVASAAD